MSSVANRFHRFEQISGRACQTIQLPNDDNVTFAKVGARFQSLSDPWADTTTHAGKLIMTVFAGIAEFERDLIRERTKARRKAARSRGVRFGRPRKLNAEQVKLARRLIDEGRTIREVTETFNVHVATIYRISTLWGLLALSTEQCFLWAVQSSP